jgi:putative oxidoreductase
MSAVVHLVSGTRVTRGAAARVTAGIRIFVGLVFVFFGALKFVITEFEVAEFVRFGFPDSALVVYLVGAVEVVAGLMLVLGLATRLAALGLAVVMAGAILTAGLTVGGPFHLGLAPALLAANLWLLRAGAGRLALDRRLTPAGTR